MSTDARLRACALVALLLVPGSARGQEPSPSPDTVDETLEAGEALAKPPRRDLVKWNHYEGPYFTIRVGGGLLYDTVMYSQDEGSRQQFDLAPETGVRDARFVLKGRVLPKMKRAITYSVGLMYDGPNDEWFMRETGFMVEVPELWGHVFVGRTKEGFSLNKVMVGYSGWTMERATINDATIPILADGIKWLGWLPEPRILWNLGIYTDWVSEGEGFSTYDSQLVGRLAWIPVAPSETSRTLLHVGMSGRYGKPNEGELKLRSRPESNLSEYFVDTGTFTCESTKMLAGEVYFRPGPLLIGSEYFVQWADADGSGDPVFHGGDVAVSWIVTGETRRYNTRGGFFQSVSPARTVFGGGPGAWELVLRASFIDLDDGTITGGKLWRVTPMLNWHLSDNLRLEAAYGYGELDRFLVTGATQFFQTRVQVTF
jgi:phosphate-selective porin OprO/OprP